MRLNKLILNLCLPLLSILMCLVILEIALRVYESFRYNQVPMHIVDNQVPMHIVDNQVPMHIVVDSPIIYGLNPEHPGISSQGLYDDEVSIPKPEGTYRILVLGDSVSFGPKVSRDKNFPNHLEYLLRKQFRLAEVINSGVSGYTAYNELQYYLTKGREFEPDIVIVAFCMNDVVNPRRHWFLTKTKIVNIPKQAIPNHNYDQKLKTRKPYNFLEKKKSLLEYSRLYIALKKRVKRPFLKKIRSEIPTFITGEDTLSIEVLLDETSPEWRWLTSIYNRLHSAVQADQATLIVAILPLAYQLDEKYPFFPQNQIAEYCRQNAILCIDLLPSFKQYPQEDIFLLNNSGYYDIWHLKEFGHKLCAKEILRFLHEKKLLVVKRK